MAGVWILPDAASPPSTSSKTRGKGKSKQIEFSNAVEVRKAKGRSLQNRSRNCLTMERIPKASPVHGDCIAKVVNVKC